MPPRRASTTLIAYFLVFLCFVPATGVLCVARVFTNVAIRMELIRKAYIFAALTVNLLQFLEPAWTRWLRRNMGR